MAWTESERRAQRLKRDWERQTSRLILREGIWKYSRPPQTGDSSQGWKLHLSATVLSAGAVLGRVLPILRQHELLYKVPANLSVLGYLNSGDAGFSQIAKCITVYTRSPKEAVFLARRLHEATRGLPGPEIPFDVRYRRNSLVYYRYGGYAINADGRPSRVCGPKGKSYIDRRALGHAVPHWLKDPFPRQPLKRPKPTGPIGLDYLVYKTFAQRGKGGVFEALDLSASPARLVVIKQGRANGETEWKGEDGYSRVKREGLVLRILRAAGIPVPRVYREFQHAGSHYLVLEKIAGLPLLLHRRKHPREPSWRRALQILNSLGPVLGKLHSIGWVWRDCKPAHIFRHRRVIRLIDFEGACPIDECDLLTWGSPDYLPRSCYNKFSRRPGSLEDDYALGVIAFQFLAGTFPPLNARLRRVMYRQMKCPDSLRYRIEGLLQN